MAEDGMNLLNAAAKETHDADSMIKLGTVAEIRQEIDFMDGSTCPITNPMVKINGVNKDSYNTWAIGIAHNANKMKPDDPKRPLLGLYANVKREWADDKMVRHQYASQGKSALTDFTLKLAKSAPSLSTRWMRGWTMSLMANGNKPEDYVLGKMKVILDNYLTTKNKETEASSRRADEGKANMQVGLREAAEHDLRMQALTKVLAAEDPDMPTQEVVLTTESGLADRFEKELRENAKEAASAAEVSGVEEAKDSSGDGPMFSSADVESASILAGIDTVPEIVTARGKTVAAIGIILDNTGDEDVEHLFILFETFETAEGFLEYQARVQRYMPRFKIYMVAVGRLFDPHQVVHNKNVHKLYANKAQQDVHDSRIQGHKEALEVEDSARAKALKKLSTRAQLDEERRELLDVEGTEDTAEVTDADIEELEAAQRALEQMRKRFAI